MMATHLPNVLALYSVPSRARQVFCGDVVLRYPAQSIPLIPEVFPHCFRRRARPGRPYHRAVQQTYTIVIS